MVQQVERETIAREAFYGSRPVLADVILNGMSYTMDGVHHVANGATLEDFIGFVQGMSRQWIDEVMAVEG